MNILSGVILVGNQSGVCKSDYGIVFIFVSTLCHTDEKHLLHI